MNPTAVLSMCMLLASSVFAALTNPQNAPKIQSFPDGQVTGAIHTKQPQLYSHPENELSSSERDYVRLSEQHSCKSSLDCQSPQICVDIFDNRKVACPKSSDACFCLFPRLTRSLYLNCPPGEHCLQDMTGHAYVAHSSNRKGLQLEECSETFDCPFPQLCMDLENNLHTKCSPESIKCGCRSRDFICKVSSDCSQGESCVEGEDDAKVCVPNSTLGPGLNFDSCRNTFDCRFPRRCFDLATATLTECDDESNTCACRTTDITCAISSDCSEGEECVKGEANAMVCVSKSTLGPGLNFDCCKNKSDCRFPRRCFDLTAPVLTECPDGSETCACRTGDILCSESSDCSEGESCVEGEGEAMVCVSNLTLGPGLNFDSCKNSSNCRFPRRCFDLTAPVLTECPDGSETCACRTGDILCKTSSDCFEGESCIEGDGEAFICASNSTLDPGENFAS